MRKTGKLQERPAWQLFQTVAFKVLRKQRVLLGHRLYLVGQRLSVKEYLILISDIPLKHGPQVYALRWAVKSFLAPAKQRFQF